MSFRNLEGDGFYEDRDVGRENSGGDDYKDEKMGVKKSSKVDWKVDWYFGVISDDFSEDLYLEEESESDRGRKKRLRGKGYKYCSEKKFKSKYWYVCLELE